MQGSEHVYTPNTTQNVAYSYPNSPYYSHTPNYSNTNPTASYNPENLVQQGYYDTNKSLTDQYQAKSEQQCYESPISHPSPGTQHQTMDVYRQEEHKEKMVQSSAMFPVKKRAYNENEQHQVR